MKDLERIYRDNFTKVYRYILSISGDEHLAEEITQETFYRAVKKVGSFRGDCEPATWLCTIGRNLYFDHVGRQNRTVPSHEKIEAENSVGESAEMEAVRRETEARVRRVIAEMEEPYGEVLALRLYSELPFAEIGKIFGKSDSWARVVYHRARAKAKEELKNENQV